MKKLFMAGVGPTTPILHYSLLLGLTFIFSFVFNINIKGFFILLLSVISIITSSITKHYYSILELTEELSKINNEIKTINTYSELYVYQYKILPKIENKVYILKNKRLKKKYKQTLSQIIEKKTTFTASAYYK